MATESKGESLANNASRQVGERPRTRQEVLQEEIKELRIGQMSRVAKNRSGMVAGLILTIVAPIILILIWDLFDDEPFVRTALIVYFFPLIMILLFKPLITPVALLDVSIEEKERELDLINADLESPERRAEKALRVHQVELQRYYAQTRSHSNLIFLAGLFALSLGFGIIAFTFYAVLWRADDRTVGEQAVLATLGTISGMLTNFVAVLQLRMFSGLLQALTDFHQRLVLTHHVHIANFLVTKIDDKDRREATLAVMATHLAVPTLPRPATLDVGTSDISNQSEK